MAFKVNFNEVYIVLAPRPRLFPVSCRCFWDRLRSPATQLDQRFGWWMGVIIRMQYMVLCLATNTRTSDLLYNKYTSIDDTDFNFLCYVIEIDTRSPIIAALLDPPKAPGWGRVPSRMALIRLPCLWKTSCSELATASLFYLRYGISSVYLNILRECLSNQVL